MKDSDYLETIVEYENLKEKYNSIVSKFNEKDFSNYRSNLFTAHSCAIEGNSFSVDETKALKEQGLKLKLYDKSMFEAQEILDHFKAYEFVMSNLDKKLDEDFLKKTHFLLTQGTIKYATGNDAGEYTTTDMIAGDTMFGDHKKNIKNVLHLLDATEKILNKKDIHPMVVSAKFHQFFIYLHPFPDGNGRLGRMISNFILARTNNPIVIIDSKKKQQYIDALKASKKHNDSSPIVSFFFSTAMKRMRMEIEQNKNFST